MQRRHLSTTIALAAITVGLSASAYAQKRPRVSAKKVKRPAVRTARATSGDKAKVRKARGSSARVRSVPSKYLSRVAVAKRVGASQDKVETPFSLSVRASHKRNVGSLTFVHMTRVDAYSGAAVTGAQNKAQSAQVELRLKTRADHQYMVECSVGLSRGTTVVMTNGTQRNAISNTTKNQAVEMVSFVQQGTGREVLLVLGNEQSNTGGWSISSCRITPIKR